MNQIVEDWTNAADDTFSYMNERKRTFSARAMLHLVDDLCIKGSATQTDLISLHGTPDFIATTLGHVTTAVHGKGAVPKVGGWYTTSLNPHTYHVHAGFAEAWKKKRRLSSRNAPSGEDERTAKGTPSQEVESIADRIVCTEDELCRVFAEKVKGSNEFAEWILSKTKFKSRTSCSRLIHEKQVSSRPAV